MEILIAIITFVIGFVFGYIIANRNNRQNNSVGGGSNLPNVDRKNNKY